MSKGKLTVTVDTNMAKMKLKLRAIAKHAEALANELDEIDKVCECGGDIAEVFIDDKPYMKICEGCGERYRVDEEVHQTTNQSDKQTI